jgi:hypothetical protein
MMTTSDTGKVALSFARKSNELTVIARVRQAHDDYTQQCQAADVTHDAELSQLRANYAITIRRVLDDYDKACIILRPDDNDDDYTNDYGEDESYS